VLIPVGVNGLVFALAGGLALALPKVASGRQFTDATAEAPRTAWYRQFVDGFRFIMANPKLRTLWFFSTFCGLASTAATATYVLFVLDKLEVPEALFGVFLLSGAVGGLLGAAVVNRVKVALGAGLTMAIATTLAGAAFVVMGVAPYVWSAAIGFGLSSLAITAWNILVMSLRQALIPGRLLGRVHGTWRTLLWGTMPLGALVGGLVARIDLALPLIVFGGLETIASLIFFRFVMSLPNPEDVDNGDPPSEPGPTDPLVQQQ
jgi:Na+/melibiose symporter-like transporter